MSNNPTRASLLLEIRDKANELAWSEFVSIYLPLLHGYALKAGLQDSDAADMAQDTLRQVMTHIDRFDYQPELGSFRGWLLTIARNLIRKSTSLKRQGTLGSGDSGVLGLLSQYAAEEQPESWEAEYRERLFQVAADIVKSEFKTSTWAAFWRTAVENTDVASVAQELGMSAGAVYIARSRVLARLREETKRLDIDSA